MNSYKQDPRTPQFVEILETKRTKATGLVISDESRELSPIASKTGGLPYCDTKFTWPVCPSCSRELSFICQVDLGQTVIASRFDGLLTFYWCLWCLSDFEGHWLAQFFPHPTIENYVQVLPEDDATLDPEYAIEFVEIDTLPHAGDIYDFVPEALDLRYDDLEPNGELQFDDYCKLLDPWDNATSQVLGPDLHVSRVGGFAHSYQGVRLGAPKQRTLLLQFSSERHVFGDSGTIYLLVENDDPNTIMFRWEQL